MTEHYYYSQEDVPFGPFSATEMRGLAVGGRIRPTDPVWKEGTAQRVQAARVKNLFPAPPLLPAASPPPALQEVLPDRGAAEEPAAVLANEATEVVVPLAGPPLRATDGPAPGRPAPAAVRQKRVVAIKGAILTGQDGVRAQFRKKCGTCGHEDGCRSTAIIRIGSSRVPFFCPKCRRARTVELTAIG